MQDIVDSLPGRVEIVKRGRGDYMLMVDGEPHSAYSNLRTAKRQATNLSWKMTLPSAAPRAPQRRDISAVEAQLQEAKQRGVSAAELVLE